MDGAHHMGEPIIGMRPAVIFFAIFMIVGAAVAIKIGGQGIGIVELAGEIEPAPHVPTAAQAPVERKAAPVPRPDETTAKIGEVENRSEGGLERVEPREPLSQLSLALPPKRPGAKGGGVILYRPIATSSARFEAMDRVIAIGGVEEVAVEERCSHEGQDWDCGIHARTAFRSFIRGRAITCDLPPDAPKETIVQGCRIGTQDVGAWLVSNGWARAAPGGPYSEAEKKAREAGRGIFGPRPKVSGELNLN